MSFDRRRLLVMGLAVGLAFCTVACGPAGSDAGDFGSYLDGGSGSGSSGGSGGSGGAGGSGCAPGYVVSASRPEQLGNGPGVALFFVSGHDVSGDHPAYLSESGNAGPDLTNTLVQEGWDVAAFHYADSRDDLIGPGGSRVLGFDSLVSGLAHAHDRWGGRTHMAVIAHSHGGVWAHNALQLLADAYGMSQGRFHLVDLDTNQDCFDCQPSRHSWDDVPLSHVSINGQSRKIVDAIPMNVIAGIELRPTNGDFDDAWNTRVGSGSNAGLERWLVDTSHNGIMRSSALYGVRRWLKEKIGSGCDAPSGGGGSGGSGGLSDVVVSRRSITIRVWDSGTEIDGDQIDVTVNGSYVVRDHVLRASPGDTFTLHLAGGLNTVVVHADNEGAYSPNTASLRISHVSTGDPDQTWSIHQNEDASFTIRAP